MIKVICENNNTQLYVKQGSSLMQVLDMLGLPEKEKYVGAYLNNTGACLSKNIFSSCSVRYIDISHFEGIRIYQRTLFLILQKAVHDLFPEKTLRVRHSVAKGFYCEFENEPNPSDQTISSIKDRMLSIICQDIPIVNEKIYFEDAEKLYEQYGFHDKIRLLRTRPRLYVPICFLANLPGYFYGELAPSTGYIKLFDIKKYYEGFYLGIPKRTNPNEMEKMIPQDKMFGIFRQYNDWMKILGVSTIGMLNDRIIDNQWSDLIKIAEALQEKNIASIADTVAGRIHSGLKLVLVSGPSSSGKTTFTKRLGIQMKVLGLDPVAISMDDYFVGREHTPRDEKGEFDFEALEAVDLELFNADLQKLIAGEEVEVPKFNFTTGSRFYNNDIRKLKENSVILIEGIHALNPSLTEKIDNAMKFRVYVSALTSISMDNVVRIATTDNRLLRRIVRDNKFRGHTAAMTLKRWESVRRGEEKHIFPYQEQADVMFNSALFYEISILKTYAEPLLHDIADNVPEYGEAQRILRFLDSFIPLPDSELPPTSILKEFLGGSSFEY